MPSSTRARAVRLIRYVPRFATMDSICAPHASRSGQLAPAHVRSTPTRSSRAPRRPAPPTRWRRSRRCGRRPWRWRSPSSGRPAAGRLPGHREVLVGVGSGLAVQAGQGHQPHPQHGQDQHRDQRRRSRTRPTGTAPAAAGAAPRPARRSRPGWAPRRRPGSRPPGRRRRPRTRRRARGRARRRSARRSRPGARPWHRCRWNSTTSMQQPQHRGLSGEELGDGRGVAGQRAGRRPRRPGHQRVGQGQRGERQRSASAATLAVTLAAGATSRRATIMPARAAAGSRRCRG